jgi:hypothetical protein
MKTALIVAAGLLAASGWQVASAAPLFAPGSTFQVSASNSPDSFTDTVPLATGTYAIDGGAVDIAVAITPAGGGAEWLSFTYSTVNGGVLSQPYQDWSVYEVGLDAAQPVNFIAAYAQFNTNGVAQTPTGNIFGGYGIEADPVPGETGTGLGASGFTAPFAAGDLPTLGTYISPWSYLNDTGINSATVNGYEEALEFTPQTPGVPEPAAWLMMICGIGGVGAMLRRRKEALAAA